MRTRTERRAVSSATPGGGLHSPLRRQARCNCATGGEACSGGDCEHRKPTLQRAAQQRQLESPYRGPIPPVVNEALRIPGQPLGGPTRAVMEGRLGHDFSQVRVHTSDTAAESARAVNALAYTVGQDVVFGAARYAPESPAGQELLAHELAHVAEQGSGPVALQRQAAVPTYGVTIAPAATPSKTIKVGFLGALQSAGGWKDQVEAKADKVFDSLDTAGALDYLQDRFDAQEGPFAVRLAGFSWGGWSALQVAAALIERTDNGGQPDLTSISIGVLDPVSTLRSSVPALAAIDFPVSVFNVFQTNGCFGSRCPGWTTATGKAFSGESIPGATEVDATTNGRGKGPVDGVPASLTPDHVHLGFGSYGGYDRLVARVLG